MNALETKIHESAVSIPVGEKRLPGELAVPAGAAGVVIFAHGSGSSRRSPRNRSVAQALQENGLATLLFDLLTEAEEREERDTAHLRFDISLLAQRLVAATDWVLRQETIRDLPAGYFGSSTGAAAALVAATDERVRAIVSRGGRPDLAGESLGRVRAPVLLIVGGNDGQVIELNERARKRLTCENSLTLVPGATHLFEEPGALEKVARLAASFFSKHFKEEVFGGGRR
ncbi:MAG: dienelactone hydrolase family protein [Limisphaerales bacterium]